MKAQDDTGLSIGLLLMQLSLLVLFDQIEHALTTQQPAFVFGFRLVDGFQQEFSLRVQSFVLVFVFGLGGEHFVGNFVGFLFFGGGGLFAVFSCLFGGMSQDAAALIRGSCGPSCFRFGGR